MGHWGQGLLPGRPSMVGERVREGGSSHQMEVDGSGGFPALGDGPNHQRLSPSRIAGREHSRGDRLIPRMRAGLKTVTLGSVAAKNLPIVTLADPSPSAEGEG